MGLIAKLGASFGLILLAIVFLPGFPPYTTFPFKEFRVTPPKDLLGPFKPNNFLDNADHILVGKVNGPEAIISRGIALYTSNNGGEVLKIVGDKVIHFAKFGESCVLPYEEAKCGRPLGLAFDTITNSLIVADGYYGLWQVDLETAKKTLLVSPQQILDGKVKRAVKLFNSVAIDKDGIIYWTDSSSDFTFEDGFFAMLSNPSGRLFRYDRSKNESVMLLDEINFANGIVLSPNEDFLVIAETASSQLLKYHFKSGEKEIFIDGLPGNPDNLTPDRDGIWIPLVMSRDSEHPAIFQLISPYPLLRRFLLRMFTLFELPFRVLDRVCPNAFSKKVLHATVSFNSFVELVPARTTIVRVDWNGKVIACLHGYDKSIRFISQVLQNGNELYLASPFNDFLGKVTLPEFAVGIQKSSPILQKEKGSKKSGEHEEL